jgi:hypothetical protein
VVRNTDEENNARARSHVTRVPITTNAQRHLPNKTGSEVIIREVEILFKGRGGKATLLWRETSNNKEEEKDNNIRSNEKLGMSRAWSLAAEKDLSHRAVYM